MKKVLSVLAIGAFLFTITSCKKDYTCECVSSVNGQEVSTSSTTINDTKSNAEEACTGDASSSGGGISVDVECSIVD